MGLPPLTPRLIDQEPPRQRSREMQVLVLGMSRTGTLSMWTALGTLGYRSYHMLELVYNPSKFPLWEEAMKAAYLGEGRRFDRVDFDKLLCDYSAVADVPCAILIEDLVRAYPEAKVVLTNRDANKWVTSVANTVDAVTSWDLWKIVAPWHSFAGPWWSFLTTFYRCWDKDAARQHRRPRMSLRQRYLDHYEEVRRVVPPERLLEFHVTDGWKPLCEFLDKPVPRGQDYPNINDSKDFVRIHRMIWWASLGSMVGKVVLPAVTAVGAGWWYWTRML